MLPADRDQHHAEPVPRLPAFTCARLRASPLRAIDPSDPTGTGDAALNAAVELSRERLFLADAIVRDLIEASRRKRQTIEHRQDVLARIDALLTEAEAIGPAESWTAAVLFNVRLLNARDHLRRYIAEREAPP